MGSVVDGAVVEWRAVPYAAPPVGDLRWRPPAPPDPWVGVRVATDFAPECLQPGIEAPVEGSEDCLYLNVTAPLGTTASSDLPVMVHLHGGSNFFFRPYRNADALVERGVIVVTVGYRLGVLGFLGHPELSEEGGGSSGEYGVLDQIAALHWVQDNIAGFGGDPDNVTLFGESAGSFDAVAIAASPLGQGLFARLAAQTESFWALNGTGTIADAEDMGSELAGFVGCSDAADVVGCLRAVPAEDLVLAHGPDDVDALGRAARSSRSRPWTRSAPAAPRCRCWSAPTVRRPRSGSLGTASCPRVITYRPPRPVPGHQRAGRAHRTAVSSERCIP